MNNRKIYNWGILGPGKIAHKFAQGLASLENAKVFAVGSRDITRAVEFGHQYHANKIYGSYEELALDKDVDIIYIATPHSEHHQHVKLCLEKGKHVLCEKAFTINARQLEELIELARVNKLFLMEAIWTRFLPGIEKTIEIISSGDLGEIKMLQADFGFKPPYDLNSRLFNPQLGGGSLLDIGIYPVFLSLLILGTPDRINAVAYKGETGVDESLAVNFLYDNGAMAVLSSSFLVKTATRADIYGTKGHITLNPRWISQTSLTVDYYEKELINLNFKYRNNGYDYEAEEVMNCIDNGLHESPRLPLKFSMNLMQIMDKIRDLIGLKYSVDNFDPR